MDSMETPQAAFKELARVSMLREARFLRLLAVGLAGNTGTPTGRPLAWDCAV